VCFLVRLPLNFAPSLQKCLLYILRKMRISNDPFTAFTRISNKNSIFFLFKQLQKRMLQQLVSGRRTWLHEPCWISAQFSFRLGRVGQRTARVPQNPVRVQSRFRSAEGRPREQRPDRFQFVLEKDHADLRHLRLRPGACVFAEAIFCRFCCEADAARLD